MEIIKCCHGGGDGGAPLEFSAGAGNCKEEHLSRVIKLNNVGACEGMRMWNMWRCITLLRVNCIAPASQKTAEKVLRVQRREFREIDAVLAA